MATWLADDMDQECLVQSRPVLGRYSLVQDGGEIQGREEGRLTHVGAIGGSVGRGWSGLELGRGVGRRQARPGQVAVGN